MKTVAWSSVAYNAEWGGAIYLTVDGREIEVCEVTEVPHDFVWPPPPQPLVEFHVDDKFDLDIPSMWRWGDLVYEGEVTKFLRLSPKAHERAKEEMAMMDRADDFGFLEEDHA